MSNAIKRFWWRKTVSTKSKVRESHVGLTISRVCILFGKVLIPVLLLLSIGVGLLYVRLLNGAISLTFLKDPIERSISDEFPNFKIRIGQPLITLKDHGFELQLTDVRLSDKTNKTVAVAPLAAVKISVWALFRGMISPSQIILIEPRLLVFYTQNDGISLTIDTKKRNILPIRSSLEPRRSTTIKNRKNTQIVVSRLSPPETHEKFNLARTISSLAERARQQAKATSYLNRIGLRNATVILDYENVRTVLRVQIANFDLAHSNLGSVLSGNIAFASKRGTWKVGLRVEDALDKNQIHLSTEVKDLYPQAIADLMPRLKILDQLQLPISAKADYSLSSKGETLAGTFEISLGSGRLKIPSVGQNSPYLNSGRALFIYVPNRKHIKLETATLSWAQSNLTLTGLIKHRLVNSVRSAWDFQLESSSGYLATTSDGAFIDVKRWAANGTLLPYQGIINVDKATVEAGGGILQMDGVVYTNDLPGISINGSFNSISAQNLLAYWPRYFNAGARKWVLKNVYTGKILDGTFSANLRHSFNSTNRKNNIYSISTTAKLADVRLKLRDKLPVISASKAYLDFKDNQFSVRIPQCALILSNDQSPVVSDLVFNTTNIFSSKIDGNAVFKINGNVDEALEMVSMVHTESAETLTKLSEQVSGHVEGDLEITFPIHRRKEYPSPKVQGQIRILDGQAKNIWNKFNINGSNIKLDLTENDIIARGDLLLRGIPININWRKNLRGNHNNLPLSISATFDDADRNALGLYVNHFIKGPISVNALIPIRQTKSDINNRRINIRVDLTSAKLNISSISWQKPIGRKAIMDFQIQADKGTGWRLSNLRVTGDSIAAKGKARINSNGKLSSFDIEDFAIDVVTRLRIKGELIKGDVWRILVHGKSFEGRNFFRALFSPQGSKDENSAMLIANLDLNVKINNVLGYWDTSLRNLQIDLSRRNGKTHFLSASGNFKNGNVLKASLREENDLAQIIISSNDSGQVFKLVGFYPNIRNGELMSIIDLENNKSGARQGLLTISQFSVLGDRILSEVLNQRTEKHNRDNEIEREIIQFDWMKAPFVVGSGRFVLRDTELRGPLLGVMLCGKADFRKHQMQVDGTYIPLQGLSSVVGSIPGIGSLLAGTKGEGIIGINFEVRGTMKQPKVIINPLSVVTPGIFRELFKVACPDSKFVYDQSHNNQKLLKKPKIDKSWASETFIYKK